MQSGSPIAKDSFGSNANENTAPIAPTAVRREINASALSTWAVTSSSFVLDDADKGMVLVWCCLPGAVNAQAPMAIHTT
eukprot:CAMPEP_0194357954 /NCGR_PEP_ID=MMETSP0174-20130528/5351_1 /TAXON_ID=216777 /ORGANISM="Proboscia alata, Strain PI-D3" /LENGTH=78 /DNA_ID=CAMNT_0039128169 /DNA_START=565 /DNA_END=801 /DNA_ORIENTATION=+